MPTTDILILSPLAGNRACLAAWLAPLGCRCEAVADEAALRDHLRRQRMDPPRLLLVDGHPAEDCYPLVNRLLGDPAVGELPILLLLDNLSDESRRLYGELLHGLDWLPKPLQPARLRERVDAALDLDAARRRLEAALAGADWRQAWREGLLAVDADGRIRFASRQAARWLRLSPLGLCGLPLPSLLESPVAAVDAAWPESALVRALGEHRALELPRLCLWRGDGGRMEAQAALLRPQAEGLPLALAFRPAAAPVSTVPTLASVARLDLLTGLPTRPALEEALASALAAARPLALLLIDIDHLRHLNDTLGHDLGDLLLRAVAGRLRAARAGGRVATLGGGRFALLLEGVADYREAGRAGRRLQAQFHQPFLLQGHEVFCSVSLGVALAPVAGHDAGQLLQVATQALERAKELGRGGLQFAAAQHNRFGLESLEREAALVAALRGHRLGLAWRGWRAADGAILAWQPRVTWPEGSADAEAVAEESGLGRALAEWCLRQCLRHPLPAGSRLLLSPDPAVLLDARAPERLPARLGRHGLPPGQVLCRVPWREEEAEAWARQLPRLAAVGLGLALQSAGTIIDLSRLAALPPVALLLDPSSLQAVPAERLQAALAGLVGLSRNLGGQVWLTQPVPGLSLSAIFSTGVEACAEDFECLPKVGAPAALPI